MIAPIFGPVDFMQERNKVAGQFTDNPFGAYLGGLMANRTPRGDSTPIYFDDHMKQYVPRPFGPQQFPEYMQARGGNPFSTDALDKQKQIRDYLDNDQKVINLLIKRGKMKAGGPSSGDFRLAGLVGYEDWTGPKEHGPYPDIFKSKNINQKGLKSLMEEMRDYRRRGIL